jgi:site-specific DNA recombinase
LASTGKKYRAKAKPGADIRNLLSEIRIIPDSSALSIELIGELANLRTLIGNKNARNNDAAGGSVMLVAGVGFEPTTFRL